MRAMVDFDAARVEPRPSTAAQRQLMVFARRIALLGCVVLALLLIGARRRSRSARATDSGTRSAGRWTPPRPWGASRSRTPSSARSCTSRWSSLGVGTLFYALAHGRRAVRRGAPRRPARPAPHAEDDRLAQRPPHRLRLRPRRAARSRATCTPRGAELRRRSTRTPITASGPRAWGSTSSRATPPTTRCCGRRASRAPARSSCARTRTPTTCSSRSPRASCASDISIVARAAARGHREEAQAGGGRPRDLALQVERHRDGAARAAPPAQRRGRRRRRVPPRGDRGREGLRGARAGARRTSAAAR